MVVLLLVISGIVVGGGRVVGGVGVVDLVVISCVVSAGGADDLFIKQIVRLKFVKRWSWCCW